MEEEVNLHSRRFSRKYKPTGTNEGAGSFKFRLRSSGTLNKTRERFRDLWSNNFKLDPVFKFNPDLQELDIF
jgi:hypothetical protein